MRLIEKLIQVGLKAKMTVLVDLVLMGRRNDDAQKND